MNWIGQNLAAAFLAFSLRNELATVVAFASPLHHSRCPDEHCHCASYVLVVYCVIGAPL